ncbi:carotenoid oxygenase family protein [Verticiella sediminum]|nr:carotenoid oxygenase family protein [Verticiella sediminum]
MQPPRNTSRREFCRRSGLLAAALPLCSPTHLAAAASIAGAHDMPAWTSPNPALTRAFAPVFDERDDQDLAVDGEIPAGLRGAYMRNGPNPRFEPDAHYSYPFDGTGMVHAIHLADGKARYRNRWVMTTELAKEIAAGRRIYNSTFAPAPHANLANTNVVRHAGRYLALYEGGQPYEVDAELATLGRYDYDGKLQGPMSAHPKIDPHTGELLSIQYDLESGALLYLRVGRDGVPDRRVPLQAPWPAMIHDIALTENHVIAFVCPLVFDLGPAGPPATWQPERGTRIALVPRDARTAADVRWLDGPPFFNWHTVNAWERDGRIEVAMPWYDAFSLGPQPRRLELHRIVIDLSSGVVRDETIDTRACEFGRVNDAYLGRPTRYGYVGLREPRPGWTPQAGTFEAIARYDLASGAKDVHRFAAGSTVGEPVFVPAPGATDEDDGYVFTFVHEEGQAQGAFHILDARNLADAPLAVVHLPRRVPVGLHGSWMSG